VKEDYSMPGRKKQLFVEYEIAGIAGTGMQTKIFLSRG
jgi:hypothetical protein